MNEPEPEDGCIERRFPDGRRAEVVEAPPGARMIVYAPVSGRPYAEYDFASVGEATLAMTIWDGLGDPQGWRERWSQWNG